MQLSIDPKIFKKYPGLRLGVVVAHGINNNVSDANEVKKKLQDIQSKFNEILNKSLLEQHSFIKVWDETFQKFGANPKKYPPSIKNMGLRITKGALIAPVNSAVDLYNSISLKYLLPLGGYDLDKLTGDVFLTYADGSEGAVLVLGEQSAKAPEVGEVIYKDGQGVMCRRWNWRDAQRSIIRSETKNALIILEALPPVNTELLYDAVNELGTLLKTYCGGTVTRTIIDEQHPSVIIKKADRYQTFEPIEPISAVEWDVYRMALRPEDTLSDETRARIEKVETLRKKGIEPWPSTKPVFDNCQEILHEFGTDQQRDTYTIAGRVMAIRTHGKTIFADVQDSICRLQIYIRQDIVGKEQFDFFTHYIDIGDIIWATGPSFKTKLGEVTLDVIDFTLLSKCLHPLPEKFHGLTDIELRYRQRYLDLICNPETRTRFIRRSLLIRSLRNFLDNHGFLEVETPMLHPIAGGAAARPFITHHNALDSDFYLRIAPELYLKRLVIGGFERVYEINRNFRNEGISTRHNPEFTMCEFYMAYHDYHFIMQFVQELMQDILKESCGSLILPFGQHMIDFSVPFRKLSIRDAVISIGGLSEADLQEKQIDKTLHKYNIEMANKRASLGEKIFALFEELVESNLIQPTFITEFPIEVSPLAKRDPDNPNVAARFELFIAGMEISNGFTELNDPFDQAARFMQQLEAHKAGDQEAHQYDADYIRALEYGLSPTVGVGIGIDRLVMLATNTTSIKDVILFPTLKKK